MILQTQKASLATEVFMCSLVHSVSLSMNPQNVWAGWASATGKNRLSFPETTLLPPLLDWRPELLNSPEHVAFSFFKKDWWHLTGLSLNLHIGFSYSNVHVVFSSPLATTLSVSFREIDPVIPMYHSWISSGTDTTAHLPITLKPAVSVN